MLKSEEQLGPSRVPRQMPTSSDKSTSCISANNRVPAAVVSLITRAPQRSPGKGQRIMMREFQPRPPRGVFRMPFHCALAALALLGLLTNSIEAADYQYPYHDPYLATATTAILSDDGATARAKSTIVHVPGLPGRNNLPSLEGRGDVSLALYRQNHPAPLLFILAGLGANPYFGVAPYLASLFYQEGSHVVVLPSPMSWNFALSASRTGAPGYAPQDARDLYEVMQKTL